MGHGSAGRATFTRMSDATQADWDAIRAAREELAGGLATRVLSQLKSLRHDFAGFPIDRYEHSLQCATRALRDGRDDEYVVCALLHDVGDLLAPCNHAEFAASMLKPYISEKNHWMLEHHSDFAGYYYYQHVGRDRNARDRFLGEPWYEYTREFCDMYVECSFDPDYDTLALDVFEPLVRRLFAHPR
jgi:predicted HD phosphohydrolase